MHEGRPPQRLGLRFLFRYQGRYKSQNGFLILSRHHHYQSVSVCLSER